MKPYYRDDAFDTLTPEARYWVGVIATDGCICQHWGEKKIVINCCDFDLVQGFATFVGAKVGKAWVRLGRKDCWRISINSAHIFDSLLTLGITERKTLTLHVVGDLIYSRDFWRGAVDGDGSIVCRKGRFFAMNLSSASIAFINQFLAYLGSLGIVKTASASKLRSGNNIYVVTLCGMSCMRLLKELYSGPCFAMARKKVLADACIAQEKFYIGGRLHLQRFKVAA